MRQQGTVFITTRCVSKGHLDEAKNTAKVSPLLTHRVVIILNNATSKPTHRAVKRHESTLNFREWNNQFVEK